MAADIQSPVQSPLGRHHAGSNIGPRIAGKMDGNGQAHEVNLVPFPNDLLNWQSINLFGWDLDEWKTVTPPVES